MASRRPPEIHQRAHGHPQMTRFVNAGLKLKTSQTRAVAHGYRIHHFAMFTAVS